MPLKNLKNKSRLLLLCFFVFIKTLFPAFGQHLLKGAVKDSLSNAPLEDVSIYLLNKQNQIVATRISDKAGNYSFEINSFGSYKIIVTSWGYKKQEQALSVSSEDPKSLHILNFYLTPNPEEIESIQVEAVKHTIIQAGDTTIFKAQQFSDSTERNIEALLKKIPGVEINEEGAISFQGKNVDKVFIDGDNLFGSNYTIGTRNMAGKYLDEVQFIDNFTENPLLKGIEQSDKLVLNLKLVEGKQVFGSTSIAYGYEHKRELQANIFSIAPKLKTIHLLSHNNTGLDLLGNLEGKDKESIPIFFSPIRQTNANIFYPDIFDKRRLNINNDILGFHNAIFKPSEKTKIQLNIAYIQKKQKQNIQDKLLNFINNDTLEIFNQFSHFLETSNLSTSVSLQEQIRSTSSLKAAISLQKSTLRFHNQYDFRGNSLRDSITENIFPQNYSFVFSKNYTKRISNRKAIDWNSYASHNLLQETSSFQNNTARYTLLDTNLSANFLRQRNKNNESYFASKLKYFYKHSQKTTYEAEAYFQKTQHSFLSNIFLQNISSDESKDNDSQANLSERRLGAKFGLNSKIKKWTIGIFGDCFHTTIRRDFDSVDLAAKFQFNPRLNVNYK